MLDLHLPDLTFPELVYGKYETPWDLRRLLYKGGAGVNARIVGRMIDAGELGRPLVERIELVRLMHESLLALLGRSGRRETLKSLIDALKSFFHWADETGNPLDVECLASSYLHWTDALLHRVKVGEGLSERTGYTRGSQVGWVVDRVLGRNKPIIKTTRLRKPRPSLRSVSAKADKQNLEDTFAFGHLLLDIADGLSLEAVWGALPLRISLRNGKVLEEWSGLAPPKTCISTNPIYFRKTKYLAKESEKKRADWEADRTLRTRYPLFNLRIMAEMFMLMGQPAVNFAQVLQLRMDQWRYKPSTHGYEVRSRPQETT